jgi:cation:H+ antiporter
MIIAISAIASGVALIWISAERLEKYSVLTAKNYGLSPFFIGSTVIAFGTSAPEMLTTFFVSLENKGSMVIGNVIGSNVANLSLVFGSMLLIVSLKKLTIRQNLDIYQNLLILLASTVLVWVIIATDPFNVIASSILLIALFLVIMFWYKNSSIEIDSDEENEEQLKNVTFKLVLSLVFLVSAAWLITFGANQILDQYNLGQLFIGYTVLAIGTSLPEIAASVSLALKGRYETVSGTLIGSNIFNGLCVLAIPGLFSNPEMYAGWNYASWSPLLLVLFIVTFLFASFIFSLSKKERKASFFISIFFLSSYFISLYFAY